MNREYEQITKDILNNKKFQSLKNEVHHHNSNRYNHCLEVSKKTYKVCKKLNLDYMSATRAALVHDFFFEDEFKNKKQQLLKHPKQALKNANQIISLNEKEQNIIESHMYPVGKKCPRYKESIVVDVVDDIVSIKEKIGGDFEYLKVATNFLFIIFVELLIK